MKQCGVEREEYILELLPKELRESPRNNLLHGKGTGIGKSMADVVVEIVNASKKKGQQSFSDRDKSSRFSGFARVRLTTALEVQAPFRDEEDTVWKTTCSDLDKTSRNDAPMNSVWGLSWRGILGCF